MAGFPSLILMLLFQLLGLLFYAVQEGNLYRGDVSR